MIDKKSFVISVLSVLALLLAYHSGYEQGYDKAETRGNLVLAQKDQEYAQKVIEEQLAAKERYEDKQKELIASFNADKQRDAVRLRQLERKLRTNADVAAVKRERDECLKLAVEGEGLLREARTIIEALRWTTSE